MAIMVNYTVQQGKAYLAAIGNHKSQFASKGFGDDRIKKLEDETSDLEAKDSSQKAAENQLEELTADQNKLAARGMEIIRSVQSAGQSAFGKEPAALRDFKIGQILGRGVPKMLEALRYFIGLGIKYHDQLIVNGLTEDDIAEIGRVYGQLTVADAKQENQKKLKNNATDARNKSQSVLEEEIFKTRKFVKSAFGKDKALLEEFNPIKRGGKGRGPDNTSPASGTPQAPTQK